MGRSIIFINSRKKAVTKHLPIGAEQLEEAPAIVFDQVSLALGDKPLFDKLSMTIAGGQCTCILGPSGCGKSTLLHLISGATSLVLSRHNSDFVRVSWKR